LIAYGASYIHGKFHSWRIFLLTIGLFTVVTGFLAFTFLPDSPVKAVRFTEAEEIASLLRAKENQAGTQDARVKKAQVIESLQDIRVWLVALSVMLTSIPNGGLSNFSNILLTAFGYTSQQSVLG
jgi:ACS family allantoate permease-like MFS transporter